VRQLADFAAVHVVDLVGQIELRQAQGFAAAAAAMVESRDSGRMVVVEQLVATMMASQRQLILQLRESDESSQQDALAGIAVGTPLAIMILLLSTLLIHQRIGGPLRRLRESTARIAGGDLEYRITIEHADEIGAVAAGLNRMTESLGHQHEILEQARLDLGASNVQLVARGTELESRGLIIELLGKMAHRLQSCENEDEFADVVGRFAPQIVGDMPGALCLLANSRNRLAIASSWGNPALSHDFAPSECWALRRGQLHYVRDSAHEMVCQHVDHAKAPIYRCLPLIAQGDVVGLLYLESAHQDILADAQRLEAMAENIALALANFRLRRALRDQSIRDSVTGLFNRRYIEEAMEIDIARAVRAGQSIGMVMVDVDHFKQFNDTFGHDGGDAVLRAVAQLLGTSVRKGDMACRYGGEEFLLVLAGSDLVNAEIRANAIREGVKQLVVHNAGRNLGQITVSAGVAAFPVHGDDLRILITAADRALYRAKAAGRDRVFLAEMPTAAAAE